MTYNTEFIKWYRTYAPTCAKTAQLTEAKVMEILEKFADKDWHSISNTDFEAIAKALTGKEKK